MRTITFEVEVDDLLPTTLTPSIEDVRFANAPLGRVFLCSNGNDGARLVMIRQSVDKDGGNKRRYFYFNDLPDYIRIVKISDPSDHFPDGLVDTDGKPEQEHNNPPVSSEVINTAVLRTAIVESVNEVYDLVDDLIKRVTAEHEEVMKHFKQVHEYHNGESKYFDELEGRIHQRIEEASHRTDDTTVAACKNILLAMSKLEDRTKEYIGHPDPPQPSATDDVTPQALLKAIEIVSGAMLRGAK